MDLRTLGSLEARLMLDAISQGQTTLTTSEIVSALGGETRARGAVQRLVKKRWLQPVGGGRYVVLPATWGPERYEDYDVFVLASASVDVGYVGWWAAAGRHGLTTQVPTELAVATDRQIAPRTLQGNAIRYVKLAARKLFGWEEMTSMGRSFRISTIEKTVVDCIDRPDLCGGLSELAVIVSSACRQLESDVLVTTAIRHGTVSVGQRLGFLMDLCAPGHMSVDARDRLHKFIPDSARSVFGAQKREPEDMGYNREWGVFANIERSALLSEVGEYTWGGRP
jgi:predicted transcriptional regulator of viral defense system